MAVLVSTMGAMMNWGMVSAGIAALIGAATLWVHFGRPYREQWRRKKPVKAHFALRPETPQHSYVVHDDERHHVETLVLPAHAEVEVEIGYYPLVPFKLIELVFGCDGDLATKPYATRLILRFKGGETFIANQHDGHYLDPAKYYHWQREVSRNVGTHYVLSFLITTRAPGLYRAPLSFITDNIEGNCELFIRVEDKPRTRMKCVQHRRCWVRPRIAA